MGAGVVQGAAYEKALQRGVHTNMLQASRHNGTAVCFLQGGVSWGGGGWVYTHICAQNLSGTPIGHGVLQCAPTGWYHEVL